MPPMPLAARLNARAAVALALAFAGCSNAEGEEGEGEEGEGEGEGEGDALDPGPPVCIDGVCLEAPRPVPFTARCDRRASRGALVCGIGTPNLLVLGNDAALQTETLPSTVQGASITRVGDDVFGIADDGLVRRASAGTWVPIIAPPADELTTDGAGRLWLVGADGVFRGNDVDGFSLVDAAEAFALSARGDTAFGLRFSATVDIVRAQGGAAFAPFTSIAGEAVHAVAAIDDDRVWVLASGALRRAFADGRVEAFPEIVDAERVIVLADDRALVIGAGRRLWSFDGAAFVEIEGPDLELDGDVDDAGDVWFGGAGGFVARGRFDGTALRLTTAEPPPSNTPFGALRTDSTGAVWTTQDNALLRRTGDRWSIVRRLPTGETAIAAFAVGGDPRAPWWLSPTGLLQTYASGTDTVQTVASGVVDACADSDGDGDVFISTNESVPLRRVSLAGSVELPSHIAQLGNTGGIPEDGHGTHLACVEPGALWAFRAQRSLTRVSARGTVSNHTTTAAGCFGARTAVDGEELWLVPFIGDVARFDGGGWEWFAPFYDVDGPEGVRDVDSVDGVVFVVGDRGHAARFEGGGFEDLGAPTTETLVSVDARAVDDVVVVGQLGTIFHFNGTRWTSTADPGFTGNIVDAAMDDAVEGVAIGAGRSELLRHSAAGWVVESTFPIGEAISLQRAPDGAIWVLERNQGPPASFDGVSWTRHDALPSPVSALTFDDDGAAHALAGGAAFAHAGGGVWRRSFDVPANELGENESCLGPYVSVGGELLFGAGRRMFRETSDGLTPVPTFMGIAGVNVVDGVIRVVDDTGSIWRFSAGRFTQTLRSAHRLVDGVAVSDTRGFGIDDGDASFVVLGSALVRQVDRPADIEVDGTGAVIVAQRPSALLRVLP